MKRHGILAEKIQLLELEKAMRKTLKLRINTQNGLPVPTPIEKVSILEYILLCNYANANKPYSMGNKSASVS